MRTVQNERFRLIPGVRGVSTLGGKKSNNVICNLNFTREENHVIGAKDADASFNFLKFDMNLKKRSHFCCEACSENANQQLKSSWWLKGWPGARGFCFGGRVPCRVR